MFAMMAKTQEQCFLARSNTSSSSSASQPADPMCLLKAAADRIKRLIAGTPDETPSASSSLVAASGSDVGAPQPGISRSNISPIVTEVLKFKRIPKKIKRPRTKEQREEIVCKVLKSTADSALSELDFDTLDKIIWFCATSPMAQHNQIANTSRRLNMVWRTMHRTVMTDMVWGAIGAASHGNARCQHGNHMILVDLLDIM